MRWIHRCICMMLGSLLGCSEWNLCQGNALHLWTPDAEGPKICHLKDFGLRE